MGVRTPVAVIPLAVDAEGLAEAASREEIDAAFPALAGRRIVLFLGRLHPYKGADLLVEAFRGVIEEAPDAILALAGPAEVGHDVELAALARRLEWHRWISWVRCRGG